MFHVISEFLVNLYTFDPAWLGANVQWLPSYLRRS
jgi:hypothetical protein